MAHEAAHYILHRDRIPAGGIYCKEEDVSRRNGKDIEKEADTFAAALLMPLHDLRRQIDPRAKPTLADLSALAERYGVSLTAATLRWLEITERRSLLVVSTEGYALWARSSGPAFKSGRFIRTSGSRMKSPSVPVRCGPTLRMSAGWVSHIPRASGSMRMLRRSRSMRQPSTKSFPSCISAERKRARMTVRMIPNRTSSIGSKRTAGPDVRGEWPETRLHASPCGWRDQSG